MRRSLVISSMLYKFGERFFVRIFGLIVVIVLARYVSNEDFGFLAILLVFENFADVFVNSGLPTALVQGRDIQESDYSIAFYIGCGIGCFFVLALFVFAPWISNFYKTEVLVWPLRIFSLMLLVHAFNGVKMARLQRKMQFRSQLVCRVIAAIVSGILGICLALKGYGLWALVGYIMTQGVGLSLMLMLADSWRPSFVFELSRAKNLFNFGSRILGVNLLNNLYNGCRPLFIGHQFAVSDLAYYDRGKWISEVVSNNYDATIQSVMLPVLAREQDNSERVKKIIRRTVSLGIFVLTPVLVGLIVLAKALIVLLITEKWLPAVEYMQILTLAFLAIPVVSTLITGIVALGYSGADLRIEVYRKVLQIGTLLYSVLAYDSVIAIAWWFVIGSIADMILVVCLTRKYVGYSLQNLFVDSWRVLVASVVVGGVVYQVSLLGWSNLLTVVSGVAIGAVVYGVICWILRVEAFIYVVRILKEKFVARKEG